MFDEEPYCQNDLEGEPLDWSTLSLYDALRHYPRSIISVSDFEMRRIRTKLTPVIYTGAKDYNFFGENYSLSYSENFTNHHFNYFHFELSFDVQIRRN